MAKSESKSMKGTDKSSSSGMRNPLEALATQTIKSQQMQGGRYGKHPLDALASSKAMVGRNINTPPLVILHHNNRVETSDHVAAKQPEMTSERSTAASTTDISDLHHPSFFEAGESEFELMHVKVTVLGLSGILSERKQKKSSSSSSTLKAATSTNNVVSPLAKDVRNSYGEESTIHTNDHASNDTTTLSEKDNTPTTAVLTYQRNVSNSSTAIASHLPSIPLGMPTSSFGFVNRYQASWAADAAIPFLNDEENVGEQSTFTLLRVMMREPFHPDDTRTGTNISSFVHETIDLRINLAKGNELIPLGVATLVISGDEEGQVMMSVPAKSVRVKKGKTILVEAERRTPKTRRPTMFRRKIPARPSFGSDSQRKYALDENATLRVLVQAIPHGTLKAAEASKARREIMMRRELERLTEENSIVESKAARLARKEVRLQQLSEMGPSTPKEVPFPKTLLSEPRFSFFCGSNFCSSMIKDEEDNDAVKSVKGNTKCVSKKIDITANSGTIDQFFKEQLGISYPSSSDMSSVSGSVSSSESESEEENFGRHINRKIVVAHKR